MITSIYPQLDRLLCTWGQKALEWRKAQDFQITEKTPGDYVTTIDQSLDRAITEQLALWFPGDGILSEENPAQYGLWHNTHRRLWCIDPIDGTSDLIEGKAGYSVMAGLLENVTPIAGWVYAPATDTLYFGDAKTAKVLRFQGPIAEEVAIFPPPGGKMQVILSPKDDRAYGVGIRQVFPDADFYSMGSFGLKVMEVVLGKASIYLYLNRRVKVWDTVAPLAIADAAGLTCCDLQGRPIGFDHNAIDGESLAHRQVVIVGWPKTIEQYLPKLQQVLNLL